MPSSLLTFRSKINKNDKSNKSTFANIRLLASGYAELYYIFQNFMDHIIDFGESNILGQKYLPARMKEYKGQKKIAFIYHGYFQGTVGNERLERVLESELFNIFAISGTYQPYSQDIRKSAEYEMKILEWVIKNTNPEEVYLIGHSQGGLVLRYMVQFLGAHQYIKKAIFLSTPHKGTRFAYASDVNKVFLESLRKLFRKIPKIEGESARQMRPDSDFIKELNSANLPAGIDYTSIYTYIDPVIFPSSNARLPYREANNIMLRKIGHMQTLYDFQAIELILKTLLLDFGKKDNFIHSSQLVEKRYIKTQKTEFNEFVTY
ncbi:hypothetical protein JXR93_08670 [bacterium]|nr:hypothetical protein [bacterium]